MLRSETTGFGETNATHSLHVAGRASNSCSTSFGAALPVSAAACSYQLVPMRLQQGMGLAMCSHLLDMP